jgi:hypothetical protein
MQRAKVAKCNGVTMVILDEQKTKIFEFLDSECDAPLAG